MPNWRVANMPAVISPTPPGVPNPQALPPPPSSGCHYNPSVLPPHRSIASALLRSHRTPPPIVVPNLTSTTPANTSCCCHGYPIVALSHASKALSHAVCSRHRRLAPSLLRPRWVRPHLVPRVQSTPTPHWTSSCVPPTVILTRKGIGFGHGDARPDRTSIRLYVVFPVVTLVHAVVLAR